MSYTLSLPSQALLEDIILGDIKWLVVFSIHYMLWPILHQLETSACLYGCDLLIAQGLLHCVHSSYPEQSLLHLLQNHLQVLLIWSRWPGSWCRVKYEAVFHSLRGLFSHCGHCSTRLIHFHEIVSSRLECVPIYKIS